MSRLVLSRWIFVVEVRRRSNLVAGWGISVQLSRRREFEKRCPDVLGPLPCRLMRRVFMEESVKAYVHIARRNSFGSDMRRDGPMSIDAGEFVSVILARFFFRKENGIIGDQIRVFKDM